MEKFSIHDEPKLRSLLQENNFPAFLFGKIENAIYKNAITYFQKIDTIPKELRNLLEENCYFDSLKLDHRVDSENGQTTKLLFETTDGYLIESVIMRHLT